MPYIKPGMAKADERRRQEPESDHKHRGRKFRGKRLRTQLPRPEADAPLPRRKEAERIAKVIARAGLWLAARGGGLDRGRAGSRSTAR